MLNANTKALIKQLNDLRQKLMVDEGTADKPEQNPSESERIENTLAQAKILKQLADTSKQQVETQNLLFEAINALEALAYTLNVEQSSQADYVNIQRTLGLLYIDYAAAKEDLRLLTVARKILKSLGSNDVRILAGLLTIAVQKSEDSLSQFYAKKLIKHDGLLPTSINMATLAAYKHTDWYDELATVIKVH